MARDYIPNNERSYKNIGNLINDARMAGLIDWLAIQDRTRNIRRNSHWTSPSDIMGSVLYSYAIDTLIVKGLKTIEQVPSLIKSQVEEILVALEVEV